MSGLSFKIVFDQPTANIYVGFEPSFDKDPGKLGVLAIAESPTPFRKPPSSSVTFDDREDWVPKYRPHLPGMYLQHCSQSGWCSWKQLGLSLMLLADQVPAVPN